MTRLPVVASDTGTWGTVLNDYLTQNVPSRYTLASSTSAGATTLTVDKSAAGILAGGAFVAIGATTTKCEIRRVTAVSSATLTVATALSYGHTAGDFVWVLDDTWVTPELFGCKANDITFDSSAGLMQSSINAALTSNTFGMTGHTSRYYSSIPLTFPDSSLMQDITFTVFGTFAVDPMVGLRNSLPDQFFVNTAGQFVSVVSVDTAANTITLSGTIGSTVGDRLIFYPLQGATLPAPLEAGRQYYFLTNPSGFTYTISVDRAGTAVDFTSSGSGTTYCFSSGLTRIKWTGVTLEGQDKRGLNGLMSKLQQPSRTVGLRIEGFPGPMGCWCLGGQQSDHFSTFIIDGSVGINLQGGQFHYLHATSLEDCDILVQSDNIEQDGAAGYGKDIHFWGCHWESPAVHTSRYQTVVGNASVSAGTFTLSFGGQTTSGIAYNAGASTIQTALEALSTIDPGDVIVTQITGLLSAGGSMQIEFSGQYAWKVLSGTNHTTVSSAGLTGGSYTISYTHPGGAGVYIKGQQSMLGVHGGVVSSSATYPNGSGINFFVNDAAGNAVNGYVLENLITLGQTGNAVVDNIRGITVPWADTTGVSERLLYFGAAGRHGGTSNKSWQLAGRTGGVVAWDEYNEDLRLNGAAKLRFGDTGPRFSAGSGSPESVVTAPIGSLFLRTNGGASTTLYVKELGTGNTGWVAK